MIKAGKVVTRNHEEAKSRERQAHACFFLVAIRAVLTLRTWNQVLFGLHRFIHIFHYDIFFILMRILRFTLHSAMLLASLLL